MKEAIKKFSGQIIGYIDEKSNGDKTVTDFSGRILGYYIKSRNCTTSFSGEVLFWGDMSAALLIVRM